MVRLIVDESCDFAAVRSLRAAGFDVVAVCEVSPRATDEEVVQLAFKDQRILVTEDKDFGQLVHASGQQRVEVLLARFPSTARREMPQAVLRVVRERGEKLMGSFVVVQPGRIRIAGPRAKA